MQRPWMVVFFALFQSVAFVVSSDAQSLWHRRDPRFSHLVTDSTARRAGDLLTILVSENTDVQNRDQRALDKSSDGSFNVNGASTSTAGGSSSGSLNISADSSRSFDGNSQYSVEQEFTDRITVQVLEVLPNGNLLVGGKRRRLVGDEQRQLEVSGTVRPIDIRPDNSIRSQFVGNFQVKYSGCGPESNFTHQGWAARLLNRVWPF